MRDADIDFLSTVGKVLWNDAEHSSRSTLETLSIVSVMNLSADHALEKATSALLERAQLEKNLNNISLINHEFYRLSHIEKFILLALHLGQWSYARIARILKLSEEGLQELAWNARLKVLGYSRGFSAYPSAPVAAPVAEPVAASVAGSVSGFAAGLHCPEYFPNRPWTQKFLDDEIQSKQERLFIQNHLFACSSCQEALNRCRESYFKIDKKIRESLEEISPASAAPFLISEEFRDRLVKKPSERTFLESFSLFLSREKLKFPFVFILAFMLFQILQFFFMKKI